MTAGPSLHPDNAATAGFTLIEMLVGIALFALIASVLAASIGTARMALSFVERSNAALPAQGARTYLHTALGQARPVQRGSGASGGELSFLGNPGSMTFTTSYAPDAQIDGIYRIEIGLETTAGPTSAFDLVVTQTLARPPAADDQPPPPVARRRSRLLDRVRSVEFNYFGALDDDGVSRWRPAWAHLDKLPRIVAIDVQFVAGDTRQWQRLIVPLFVSDTSSAPCPPRRSC